MIAWSRRTSALLLVSVLALGVSCTPENTAGPSTSYTPAALTPTDQQSGQLLGGVLDGLKNLHLLSCSEQPYVSVTRVVGPEGGTIVCGSHQHTAPADVLAQRYTVQPAKGPGRVTSVRVTPEGRRFADTAGLTLSYANCSPLLLLEQVV